MEFAFVGAKMSVFYAKICQPTFSESNSNPYFRSDEDPLPVNCYFMQPENSPTVHEQITRCCISLNSLFLIGALVSLYCMS